MLGNLYNSNANIIYNIVNFLSILAGIALVASIVYAMIKMVTGDEGDHQRYLRRVRNGIIALILIITLNPIVKLVTQYISPDETKNSFTGIGDFSDIQYATIPNGDGLTGKTDTKNRPMIIIDGEYYVRTAEAKSKNFGSWNKRWAISVEEYKEYDVAQRTASSKLANVSYYKIIATASGNNSDMEVWRKIEDKKDWLIPGNYKDLVGEIKSEDVWNDLINYLVSSDNYTNL